MRPTLAPLLLIGLQLLPSDARSTPFTLPARRLAVDLALIFDQATSQWDVAGRYGVFPLAGEFTSQSLFLGFRYGIIEGLEAQARASYKFATFAATPFHLFPAAGSTPAVLTDAAIDVGGTAHGFADIYTGLSYRPLKGRINLAIEAELKIPTGYRAPSGTFCANLTPQEVAEASVATSRDPAQPKVRPGDFCSGATLGDGQVDLLVLGELGRYIELTRTFFRLEGGMNFRFQGPGQQVVAQGRVGENILDVVVIYAGLRFAYTVNRGETIGTTVNSRNPSAPARDYPGDLLLLDPATRDRDFLFVDVGLIVRLSPVLELRAGYSRALWGRNFPELNTVSLGMAVVAL